MVCTDGRRAEKEISTEGLAESKPLEGNIILSEVIMMKRFGLVLFGFALCTTVLQRSPLLWAGYLKFDKKR